MKRIVPAQSLSLKTRESIDDRLFSKRQLVLHNHVNDRVELIVGQSNSLAVVI